MPFEVVVQSWAFLGFSQCGVIIRMQDTPCKNQLSIAPLLTCICRTTKLMSKCRHTPLVLLQSSVISVAWSVANYVLQGQIMGFKVDTWPHTLGPSSNYAMVIVSVLVVIFAHIFVVASFLFTAKPLSLYHFPSQFKYKFYGILLAAAGVFVAQRSVRQVARRAQQQRYEALLRGNSAGRQLSSSRNSLGSAERMLPNSYTLGMQQLGSKLRWLSFRAPKVHPLTPEMSIAIASASGQSKTVKSYPPAKASPKSSQRSTAERV